MERPMLRFAVVLTACVTLGLLFVERDILAVTILPWLSIVFALCGVFDGRRVRIWSALLSASIIVWNGSDTVAVRGKSIPVGEHLRIDGQIQNIWPGRYGNTILVDGILDTKHLVPFQGRVLIRCRSQSLGIGDRVIVTAISVREHSASTFRRSQGALCSVRAVTMTVSPSEPSIHHWLIQRREDVHNLINRYLSADTRHIAVALVTGDSRNIDTSERDVFIRSGTAHMFSVSGSHVAVIFAIVFLLTSWLGRSWLRVGICVSIVLAFVVFTGASDAALRAGIMGSLWLVARRLERTADGLDCLATAIVVMLIINPLFVFSIGATLSVAATSTIILLTTRWQALFTRLTLRPKKFLTTIHSSIAVTLAATAGVTIPTAITFAIVVPLSPLNNMIVVPILTFAMIAVLIVIGCAVVVPPLASIAAWTADSSIRLAVEISSVMAGTTRDLNDTFARISVAVILTLLSTWPLMSTTWAGFSLRCTLCVAGVVIITMFAP